MMSSFPLSRERPDVRKNTNRTKMADAAQAEVRGEAEKGPGNQVNTTLLQKKGNAGVPRGSVPHIPDRRSSFGTYPFFFRFLLWPPVNVCTRFSVFFFFFSLFLFLDESSESCYIFSCLFSSSAFTLSSPVVRLICHSKTTVVFWKQEP